MFQKLISHFRSSPPLSPPPQRTQDLEGAHLKRIIVPQSAFDATDSDPHQLVGAVVTFVNHLTSKGRFTRNEVPHEALLAYHTDFYLAQVNNGGHAQFIGNSLPNLEFVLADVGRGLKAAGANGHRDLYEKMQTWVALNPREVAKQTGFDGGIAPELAALDTPFYQLENQRSLTVILATWLKGLPNLQVVADNQLPRVLYGITTLNPELDERAVTADIARLVHQLSDDLHLGFGMVAASKSPPEPVTHLGAGAQMDIEPGLSELAFAVRTVAAERYCVRNEAGFALYEKIEGDNSNMPKVRSINALSKVSLDDVRAYQPPKVGARLATVPTKMVEIAALVCQRFHAGAAIDLLLRSLPEPSHATFLSVRSVGTCKDGKIGTTVFIVADNATRAFTALVDVHGAKLLAEPSQDLVAEVSRRAVDAHAEAHSGR